jgi:hypothetical protein
MSPRRVSDPALWFVALIAMTVAAALREPQVPAWVSFGALAGLSLSGSV